MNRKQLEEIYSELDDIISDMDTLMSGNSFYDDSILEIKQRLSALLDIIDRELWKK